MSLLRSLLGAALLAHALPCAAQQPAPGQAVATFAGGCFWCMNRPTTPCRRYLTTSGYMGEPRKIPATRRCPRDHGARGVVQVLYDPKR